MARYVLHGVVLGLAILLGFIAGYWARGDVQAYSQRVVAVEGEPVEQPPCGDTWTVLPGDTLWQVAATCFSGHTGQAVHEIRAVNPGVDVGRLQVGQRLTLPERGR